MRSRESSVATRGALVVVGAVALAYGVFALSTPPREAVVGWLLLLLASLAPLAWADRRLAKASIDRRTFTRLAVAGALALRLGAWLAPASLSDDIHRYAWDGALLLSAESPYGAPPSARELGRPGLNADSLAALNSPDYATIYPPLSQATFALGALAGRLPGVSAERALRAIFVGADLLAVFLLAGLLRRLERPRAELLVYAWHPMVVWEVAAGGHTEALLLPALIASAHAALEGRSRASGAWLGVAVGVKLSAAALIPIWLVYLLRRGPRHAAEEKPTRWRATLEGALASLLVPALAFAPFASPTLASSLGASLALFREELYFNAPLYLTARRLAGYEVGVTPPVDHIIMPWLDAVAIVAVALFIIAQNGRARRLLLAWAAAPLVLWMASRVFHPWYAIPPLSFAVATRFRAPVLLALLLPATYLAYDPIGYEHPAVSALVFGPPLALAIFECARRRA